MYNLRGHCLIDPRDVLGDSREDVRVHAPARERHQPRGEPHEVFILVNQGTPGVSGADARLVGVRARAELRGRRKCRRGVQKCVLLRADRRRRQVVGDVIHGVIRGEQGARGGLPPAGDFHVE